MINDELWRDELEKELSALMKEAKKGELSLEWRKQFIEEMTETHGIKAGDPLLIRMADLLLAEYIGSTESWKGRQKDAFLTDNMYEARVALDSKITNELL
ncbi:hypothetical protein LMU11_001488 [Listeria monocytogenes]|nr:hypothetical protein [Listeria monocytogenes]EIM2090967.1 hypothetical protein [Listeria monocytogenes]EIM2258585.1 hypothetical protein [Listeria monocytogenes]